MKFSQPSPLSQGQTLSAEVNVWTGKTRILLDGEELPLRKGEAVPYKNGEKDVAIRFEKSAIDPAPVFYVDDTEYRFAEKLKIYEIVIACFPFVMVTFGGAIGGGLGALAAVMNLNIIRSDRPLAVRLLMCLLSAVGALTAWALAAGIIQSFV